MTSLISLHPASCLVLEEGSVDLVLLFSLTTFFVGSRDFAKFPFCFCLCFAFIFSEWFLL